MKIGLAVATLAALALVSVAQVRGAQTGPAPVFATPQTLPGASGGSEPRVAVAPDGTRYIIAGPSTDGPSGNGGLAVVYASRDGGKTWRPTGGIPAGQNHPTADVDLVATGSGRLVAAELDAIGLSVAVSYSDDGGRTWSRSTGLARLADQDRPWLAAGPKDPKTGRPRVYLLFHNGQSSNVTHEMFVETSTDDGATFGLPVPIAAPASPAWLDLQCADAGAPSNIAVNQTTGQLYAFWGTRHTLLGGCGTLPPTPFTFVAATRVWVAMSPSGDLGSWTTSLAVDDASSGKIVGMQFTPGAIDRSGDVYVAYTESPRPYPDFTGAAIRVRHAPPDLRSWSSPVTVASESPAGNLLPHLVAGAAGKFAVAYFAGVTTSGKPPQWYATVAEVVDGMSSKPPVTTARTSNVPAYKGTASQLMLVCDGGLLGIVENNPITCTRSTDVWGIALDQSCNLTVTWPSLSAKSDPRLGVSINATWVDTQVGGPSLC